MSRSAPLLLVAASLCAASCHGSVVRGGTTVAAGYEPPGHPLFAYRAVDCKDASGGPVEYQSRVFVIQKKNNERAAVETRSGFDSLVVDNSFVDGQSRVFQAVVKPRDGKALLHEFRVPAGPPGPGKLIVTSSFRETDTGHGRFKAVPDAPSISCTLSLGGSNPGPQAAGAGGAAPVSADAGPAASGREPPVPPGLGVPDAQDSYKPDDHVAVDHDGKVVRARVVQAVGGRYYVQYDAGGSEWIDKSVIRGKIR